MKKLFLLAVIILGINVCANAQSKKPTKEDIGKDCVTEDSKLGTWKEVTVTEHSGSKSSESSNWGVNGGLSVGVKNAAEVSVGGSYGESKSRERSSDESITYQDIRCVEDKNANLPQMSPVRW